MNRDPDVARSKLEIARARLKEIQDKAASLPVELQVRDAAHARSPEVLKYCIDHLAGGGTWLELKMKLGIRGGAHSDPRWRIIRSLVVEGLLPETDDEAMKAQISQRAFMLDRLEGFLEEVEERLLLQGDDKQDKLVEPMFYKIRMEAMKILLEENEKSFTSHIEMRRLKQAEKKNQGKSIIVNNKFYIPRPGDDLKAMREVSNVMADAQALLVEPEEDDDGE